MSNVLYIVEIKAEGFILDIEEILVDCISGDCENERLVALSPELQAGETRIIVTWVDKPMDVDVHVMAIKNSENGLWRTWFEGQNDCPSISHLPYRKIWIT